MSQRTFLAFVLVALVVRGLLIPLLPLLEPSEARYAVVARDMVESGDFLTPRVWTNGEYVPFFSKPPLLFWLQALALASLGPPEVAVRLPSLLAAVAVLAATWLLLQRLLAADVLRAAILILTSSPLFFFTAGIGLTDMLLCASVSGALFSHLRFTRAHDERLARRFSLLTFALLGVGMIAKGPIALVEFGLPTFAWSVWNRRLGDLARQAWWPGLLLFALPWVPWYALEERANPDFLRYFLLNENLLRFVTPDYGDRYGGGHAFPPTAAIVFFALAVLPWLAYLGWRVREPAARSRAARRLRDRDLQLLAFAVVANLLFLSFARHILGTYVLPILPAAAVLLAAALASADVLPGRIARIATILVLVYGSSTLALLPVIEGRWSTRTVLRQAAAFQEERGAAGRIVFVEKLPFSARFYGGASVDTIPWNAGSEHFEWYLQPENGHLLVLRWGHPEILDPYVTGRLRLVEETGRYSIWEPIRPASGRVPAPKGSTSPRSSKRSSEAGPSRESVISTLARPPTISIP